jgi:hypothetical protein
MGRDALQLQEGRSDEAGWQTVCAKGAPVGRQPRPIGRSLATYKMRGIVSWWHRTRPVLYDRLPYVMLCTHLSDWPSTRYLRNRLDVQCGVASSSFGAACGSRTAAADSSPSFHNKRPYSNVAEEHPPGDDASDEPVRTHEAHTLPPRTGRDNASKESGSRSCASRSTLRPFRANSCRTRPPSWGSPRDRRTDSSRRDSPSRSTPPPPQSKKRSRTDNISNIQNDQASAAPAAMVTVHPWQVTGGARLAGGGRPGAALRHEGAAGRNSPIRGLLIDHRQHECRQQHNSPWQLEVVVHMTPQSEWMQHAIGAFSSQSDVEHAWLSTDPMARYVDEYNDGRATSVGDYGTPFRAAALGTGGDSTRDLQIGVPITTAAVGAAAGPIARRNSSKQWRSTSTSRTRAIQSPIRVRADHDGVRAHSSQARLDQWLDTVARRSRRSHLGKFLALDPCPNSGNRP